MDLHSIPNENQKCHVNAVRPVYRRMQIQAALVLVGTLEWMRGVALIWKRLGLDNLLLFGQQQFHLS